MAIKRVQSPFAASERAIRRLERQEQAAARSIQKQESRAFDERMRQRGVERRRQEEIRRKAGLADEDRKMRKDLIMSLARGEGVGMFGAKLPRINKFIIHAGEESKDPATGKIVRSKELGFEPQIDPEHIGRLRTLAAQTRDDQAARALALQGTGRLPKRQENALSDLASDDFPAFSRLAPGEGGAEPDQPMPDPITGGAYVPPEVGMGGPGPGGDVQAPGPQLAPGDIDLTQLLQTGTMGPPLGPTGEAARGISPEQFQPGFEQGFQGPDQPAAPIENIHEIIQAGGLTGKAAPQQKGKLQDYDAFRQALQREPTEEETLRFFKAEEKLDPAKQLLFEMARKGAGLGPTETTAKTPSVTPTATATAAPTKQPAPKRGPKLSARDLDFVRSQYAVKHPDRIIASITTEDGTIVIKDDSTPPKVTRIRRQT